MQTSTTVAAVNEEMRRPGLEVADSGVIGDLATDVSASPSGSPAVGAERRADQSMDAVERRYRRAVRRRLRAGRT
jgi:hypothetical protein